MDFEALGSLPLGALRYMPRVGSTNDELLQWAEQGAPDLAVVAADEQTAGRGRAGRRWFTPPGAALAVSVLLRAEAFPRRPQGDALLRLSGLGAVSVCLALRQAYGLPAQVKWPNDVLLDGRKAAGVLVELSWRGDGWQYAVIGMGVNVRPEAVPPPQKVRFPAVAVESVAGKPLRRTKLLYEILSRLVAWRARLHTSAFLRTWEENLAWLGEQVRVQPENGAAEIQGTLLGLAADGALRLQTPAEGALTLRLGEVRLRPAGEPMHRTQFRTGG